MKFVRVSYYLLLLLFFTSLLTDTIDTIASDESIYIIHMDNSVMPTSFATTHMWYDWLITSIKIDRASTADVFLLTIPNVLYTYTHVIHGFSVVLTLEQLQKLKNCTGFLLAYEDTEAELATTHSIEFLSLKKENGLWRNSAMGRDVIIGVIDTGVWPESRSYRDDNMMPPPPRWKGTCEAGERFLPTDCNNKLIGARYFNKGAKAKYPDFNGVGSPRDFNGHGTHTSSIAAGNFVEDVSFFGYAQGTAKGVAPHSWLATYKVGDGYVLDSDLLAGFDQAVSDGVDVISVSLGNKVEKLIPENSYAIASFAAMEKGVFVAMAAGNAGPNFRTLRNSVPWAMIVGASSVDRSFSGILTLGNGETLIGWSLFTENKLQRNYPLYYEKSVALCDNVESLKKVGNSIVICESISERSSLEYKLKLVSKAKVAGVILVFDGPLLFEFSEFQCPGVVISKNDASVVMEYVNTYDNPLARITFHQTILGTEPAPVVASYSSRGPSIHTPKILKPDLVAPGTLILAAYVPKILSSASIGEGKLPREYILLSGTSMATPHVAGVAALLKCVHPTWSPAAISSAMITTANPLDTKGNAIRNNDQYLSVASPLDMGGGLIDPNKASDPGLVYDVSAQDFVSYLCAMEYTEEEIMAITRSHKYDCSTKSSDINYPSFTAARSKTSFFERSVTYVGKGTASFTASVEHLEGCSVKVRPNTLAFDNLNEKKKYSITINCDNMQSVTHGWLVWRENIGTRTVRSPIVVI